MAGTRDIIKVNNLNIRISDADMRDLEYLCSKREMNKTDMVVYLIRREADRFREKEEK